MPHAIAVIPARYQSSRFPGKVLANRTGKPLIQHVYERVQLAECVDRIIIATDDRRISQAVEDFGGEAVMTRSDHPNGTCRIAEVAESLTDEIIINVQGDEPELEPHLIDLAVQTLVDHPECPISTVASPFAADEDPANPNIVKVVVDQRGRALYFSRALIPAYAGGSAKPRAAGGSAKPQAAVGAGPLKHVGMYVYRLPFLAEYVSLPPTPLERAERLEQLRVLEHGHFMAVAIGDAHYHGVDTPEQYDEFVRRYASE